VPQRLDFTIKLPKLYIVTIKQLFGALSGRVVVIAEDVDGLIKCPSSPIMYARYSAIGFRAFYSTSEAASRGNWPIRLNAKLFRLDGFSEAPLLFPGLAANAMLFVFLFPRTLSTDLGKIATRGQPSFSPAK
jgi:hypothetical protein